MHRRKAECKRAARRHPQRDWIGCGPSCRTGARGSPPPPPAPSLPGGPWVAGGGDGGGGHGDGLGAGERDAAGVEQLLGEERRPEGGEPHLPGRRLGGGAEGGGGDPHCPVNHVGHGEGKPSEREVQRYGGNVFLNKKNRIPILVGKETFRVKRD